MFGMLGSNTYYISDAIAWGHATAAFLGILKSIETVEVITEKEPTEFTWFETDRTNITKRTGIAVEQQMEMEKLLTHFNVIDVQTKDNENMRYCILHETHDPLFMNPELVREALNNL